MPGLNSTGDRCPTCYYCSANQFDHTSITIIRPRRYNTLTLGPDGAGGEIERETKRKKERVRGRKKHEKDRKKIYKKKKTTIDMIR